MKCAPVLLALAATAAPPIDQMKKQAFLIVVEFNANGKEGGGTGSGFPIDPTHVVTNFHVCCFAPESAQDRYRRRRFREGDDQGRQSLRVSRVRISPSSNSRNPSRSLR